MAQLQQQQKLPTPSTSHLDFATIYEPAEDSFLFLDTLTSTAESAFLHSRFHQDTDTDTDTTRIVQADLSSALQRGCVDVLLFNPPYVPTESVPVPVTEDACGQMDRFERESQLLALSYAGGEDGMEVTERLLAEVPGALSARGAAYVLFCARNKAGEALKRLMAGEKWRAKTEGEEQWEWAAEVVGKTGGKGGWERLEIWRIWRRFSS
ncbi:hypothetical protein DV737_g5263, partial [Chaetothyriales sp. CBS 132003]